MKNTADTIARRHSLTTMNMLLKELKLSRGTITKKIVALGLTPTAKIYTGKAGAPVPAFSAKDVEVLENSLPRIKVLK